jgi:hypothetical protein
MRTIASGWILFAGLCCGQNADLGVRTFVFTHTATDQQFQEAVTLIRTVTDIQQASIDNPQKSVTVRASPGQIAMAEWLFNELDTQTIQASVPHEYRVPGATDDLVRLFYLPTAPTVQDFQEIATVVRTIAGFQRAFTYNEPRAYVVRGTGPQIGLAEWLLNELQPSAAPSAREYRMPGSNDDVVGVVYLDHTASVQAFQDAAKQIREAAKIMKVFTYNRPRAMTVRGTADQIALAERLAKELDHP